MKENIEEDMKRLERISKYFNYHMWEDDINSLAIILSDYKRVLKENKELLREKIENKKIIALAQNEFLGYEQGYQDGKASRRSATQAIIEGQQYYIIQEQIERYKNQIEKLQKENKELKEDNKNQWEERCKLTFEFENYIPKQKLKDKIEELEPELKFEITERESKLQINLLKSLLEGEF